MKTTNHNWQQPFRELYEKALARYSSGHREPQTMFTPEETEVLRSLGAKPMELYDYAEDSDDVDWETALLIAAVRRDYFLQEQNGIWSEHLMKSDALPPKPEPLEGIPWLPRLIEKAKGRLRGELPDEVMYCCGGDRNFFQTHDIHPADFLRLVWAVKGEPDKIVAYVKKQQPVAG